MTHNEKRLAWYKEGFYTLIGGTVYGAASVVVGHPLDTIKTKMQAQSDYMGSRSVMQSIREVYRLDGLRGFYAGAWPPLFGSIVFRSLQFSVFESFYTYTEKYEAMKQSVPGTYGVQYRVFAGGLAASFARASVRWCSVRWVGAPDPRAAQSHAVDASDSVGRLRNVTTP